MSLEEYIGLYYPDVVQEWESTDPELSLADFVSIFYEDLANKFHDPMWRDTYGWVNSEENESGEVT